MAYTANCKAGLFSYQQLRNIVKALWADAEATQYADPLSDEGATKVGKHTQCQWCVFGAHRTLERLDQIQCCKKACESYGKYVRDEHSCITLKALKRSNLCNLICIDLFRLITGSYKFCTVKPVVWPLLYHCFHCSFQKLHGYQPLSSSDYSG